MEAGELKGLGLLISPQYNPWLNLAAEEWLLRQVPEGEHWLFLWRNEKTVVIGRNQDAFAECRISKLREDGGRLARRLSGGGAVFHDLGNLNFTFLHRGETDVPRHLRVIALALERVGIRCDRGGRNDLTVGDRKFSGSAYYRNGDRQLHHGTIMVSVDRSGVEEYLTPHRLKLSKRGVSSVSRRVVDLAEIRPGLTVGDMIPVLAEAFETVYGLPCRRLPEDLWDRPEILRREAFFASDAWCLRPLDRMDYQSGTHLLEPGLCRLCLKAREGRITEAVLLTDALDLRISETVSSALHSVPFRGDAVRARLEEAGLRALLPLTEDMPEA